MVAIYVLDVIESAGRVKSTAIIRTISTFNVIETPNMADNMYVSDTVNILSIVDTNQSFHILNVIHAA